MDESILDKIEEDKLEGLRSQPKYYIARYLLCLHSAYIISLIILSCMQVDDFGIKSLGFGIVFQFLHHAVFIYYNISHGILEQKNVKVKPRFSRNIILAFIIFLLVKLIGFILGLVEILAVWMFSMLTLISIIIIVSTVIVLLREIEYYKWKSD